MTDAAITVEDLRKRFGEVVALDGVSFEAAAGTILGLLGPNGAGKTTAVRILTTILRPDGGRATVLGRDVCGQAEAVRGTIGLAGQYAAVDENLTGRENLRLVGKLTHQPKTSIGARAVELLERFDLMAAADRPVRTYSGGMRRRLDLAAALVHRPPVLFLDEPTTGLDPRSRTDLWGVIGELVADGTTVLLTSQYLEEVDRLADRVVVVDEGKVIADGTAGELKHDYGGTVVDVVLASKAAAKRIIDALGDTFPAEVDEEGRTVTVTVPDPGASVVDVIRALDKAGDDPERVTVREPSLDDVFLQLTGHRVETVEEPVA